MNPQYGPWGYNFAASYYYKVCHYYDSDNKPYIFFMIWHPSYPQYYYCYYPISPTAGFYWCRCYSPNHPQYNPFYFSRIPGIADTPPEQFGQLADQYPTIEAANPFFDNFDTMPAHYPPSFTLPMQPLPPGLPTG